MVVNQKFIAEKAGVSQKTVSLYFKEHSLVGRKTREKIEAVTKRHNYFPNLAARSIKSNRFNRIACVVAQYGSRDTVTHPHLLAYINGASLEFAPNGYSLVVEPVFIELDGSKVEFPDFFSSRSADGIIGLVGSWIPPEVDQKVMAQGLPTVWLNRWSEDKSLNCLLFDEDGARELAEHFLKCGIGKVDWFGPDFAEDLVIHYSSGSRYEAVRRVIQQAGGEVVSFFCHTQEPLVGKGRELVARMADFDGVICYGYSYRHTMLMEALATGVDLRKTRIGYFSSVWEFHSNNFNNLDYVLMPEVEMGRLGAEYILKRLNEEDAQQLLKPLAGKLHIAEQN